MAKNEDVLALKENLNEVVLEDVATTTNMITSSRIDWYYAPAFLLFWFVLFVAVVLPLFFNLPNGLTLANEKQHSGKFIAERAELILFEFDKIGPKVTGSYANENVTVQLLHDEVAKIRRFMHHDLFDMEVDVQVVSGAYIHWSMINMYQGVQNFVVKLSCKNSTSENYLLINSHFDSKVGSPGTGDDGAMVVIMLEILRVLATNRETFQHPIVFLFNGAEENPLQASHGFITQHKWAKKCKALMNLDAAGSGNREFLFQSGPNHPWLMKLYNKHVVRPFASTLGEELFEAHIIASDTDFRIFRDFGHVPGLDFAHFYNGYVYHTNFDTHDVVPRGTLQATGDNILSLTKAFANAPEMEDTEKYSAGHSVFYDVLGVFFIYYTESDGNIINTCVSVIVLIAIGISIWQMADLCNISVGSVMRKFALILVLHFIGIILAVALPILMAVIFDSGERSMTWFASKWLVLGLYVSPSLFGLTLPSLLYLSYNQSNHLKECFKIQLIQHSHAVIIAVLCIVISVRGFRSSYLLSLILFFYGLALVFNIMTTLHYRDNLWCIVIILGQILPFIYTTYICFILLTVLVPMTGFGAANNPDLLIAGICAFGSIISMGFVMPVWNMFRHSKCLLLILMLTTFVFSMIAITPIGFPYRPKTHVARIYFLNARRVFYEYDGSVSFNESGYYFDLHDKRLHYPQTEDIKLSEMKALADDCSKYMMCGLPLFNHRMVKNSKNGKWLPSKTTVQLPATPKLIMLNKTFNATLNTSRFEFELSGPPHMSIFLQPLEGVTVMDWSFLKPLLQEPPYHIYFTYGKLSTPLKFHFDLKLSNNTLDNPLFELGISGHYVSNEYERGRHAKEFISKFPDYIYVMEWPSSYERYLF